MKKQRRRASNGVRGGKATKGRPGARASRRKRVQARSKRYTEDDKRRALEMVAADVSRWKIASALGTTTESIRRWVKLAESRGEMPVAPRERPTEEPLAPVLSKKEAKRSPYAPRDPANGLGEHETAAILELKKRHPSMGPAQLKAQLKRFKGWRLSIKAIARVLRAHGYEPVHRGPPKGPAPIRWEAPRRNAVWQLDFAEVRVVGERLHVLVILDDFSRFVVGHVLADAPSSEVATTTLKAAIARHGKPESVRTDRGGAFVAYGKDTDFGRYLEAEEIDHIVGRPYSPRGGGKVEAAIGTLRRELWEIEHFSDRFEAARKVARFFADYNERRAHMGIDGLTPADRFWGRADRVLAQIDAASRGRQGLELQRSTAPGATVEELFAGETGAPLEVLRLVIVDGRMELRFCGARVELGRVEV